MDDIDRKAFLKRMREVVGEDKAKSIEANSAGMKDDQEAEKARLTEKYGEMLAALIMFTVNVKMLNTAISGKNQDVHQIPPEELVSKVVVMGVADILKAVNKGDQVMINSDMRTLMQEAGHITDLLLTRVEERRKGVR